MREKGNTSLHAVQPCIGCDVSSPLSWHLHVKSVERSFFFLLCMLNAFYHYCSFILLLFKYGHHVYIRTKKNNLSF